MEQTTPIPPRIAYKPSEFAALCGVSAETVCKWCEAGEIRFTRLAGKTMLIPATEVERIASGGEAA